MIRWSGLSKIMVLKMFDRIFFCASFEFSPLHLETSSKPFAKKLKGTGSPLLKIASFSGLYPLCVIGLRLVASFNFVSTSFVNSDSLGFDPTGDLGKLTGDLVIGDFKFSGIGDLVSSFLLEDFGISWLGDS